MYHYPNKSIVHNGYQQFFSAPLSEQTIDTQENQSDIVPHSLVETEPPVNPPKSESVQVGGKSVKCKGGCKQSLLSGKKGSVDTSSFTVEQRVVAAAWVHERHYTHTSIGQIKQQFVERFGRPAPAKNTLLVWEQKLFSSGSVHDAPRTGRPAKRKVLVGEVAASLRAAPTLSVRARAAALRVPTSTLRALLRRHLPDHVGVGPPPATNTNKQVKQKAQLLGRPAPEPR